MKKAPGLFQGRKGGGCFVQGTGKRNFGKLVHGNLGGRPLLGMVNLESFSPPAKKKFPQEKPFCGKEGGEQGNCQQLLYLSRKHRMSIKIEKVKTSWPRKEGREPGYRKRKKEQGTREGPTSSNGRTIPRKKDESF